MQTAIMLPALPSTNIDTPHTMEPPQWPKICVSPYYLGGGTWFWCAQGPLTPCSSCVAILLLPPGFCSDILPHGSTTMLMMPLPPFLTSENLVVRSIMLSDPLITVNEVLVPFCLVFPCPVHYDPSNPVTPCIYTEAAIPTDDTWYNACCHLQLYSLYFFFLHS